MYVLILLYIIAVCVGKFYGWGYAIPRAILKQIASQCEGDLYEHIKWSDVPAWQKQTNKQIGA